MYPIRLFQQWMPRLKQWSMFIFVPFLSSSAVWEWGWIRVWEENEIKQSGLQNEVQWEFSLLKALCVLETAGAWFLKRKAAFARGLLKFYFRTENSKIFKKKAIKTKKRMRGLRVCVCVCVYILHLYLYVRTHALRESVFPNLLIRRQQRQVRCCNFCPSVCWNNVWRHNECMRVRKASKSQGK